MADIYNPKTWATDEEVTSVGLNAARDTETFLFNRLLPIYAAGQWTCETGLGLFVINANIYPGNQTGSGDNGLTWAKVSGGAGASFMVVQFQFPSDCFTTASGWTKPLILGLTVGAGEPPLGYPWLVPTARYQEGVTAFTQRFGMTNNPPTVFGSDLFNVSGLVVGPRKLTPQ